MKEFIEFIKEYWTYIAPLLLLLLEILFFVLKKGDSTKVIDNGLYHKLVGWIKEAEYRYSSGEGPQKLRYVLAKYGCENPDASATEIKFIEAFVDDLLTLPTKKGGPGREETK